MNLPVSNPIRESQNLLSLHYPQRKRRGFKPYKGKSKLLSSLVEMVISFGFKPYKGKSKLDVHEMRNEETRFQTL